MRRAVKAGEFWSTFIFDNIDCADLGVYAVTSSSTYTTNLVPTFADKKTEVTAYDGQYYYGTQITGQQFTFEMFAENLTHQELNRLKSWLNPRHIGRLVLSDQPYKYYFVKPVSVSALANIPLTTIQTPSESVLGDFCEGDLVYVGRFSITFETVGSAYGYGLSYYRDDLIYDAKEKYGRDYYYNSGLLYKDMCPAAKWDIETNAVEHSIPMYNPGSAEGKPTYKIEHDGKFADHSYIRIDNKTYGTSTIIDISGLEGDLTISIVEQTVQDERGNAYYGRFSGSNLSINPFRSVIELPETFAEESDTGSILEYDSFYINNNVVEINPKVLLVSEDMVGRYFCVNGNGGNKIKSISVDANSLQLSDAPKTYDIPAPVVQDGTVVQQGGFKFEYLEVNNVMPTTGSLRQVCVVDDVWYVYKDKWIETNLFSSKEDFKNIYGNYIPVYRMFGATIVELDDITITTGTNIKYKNNEAILTGASVPAFTLSAEMQPRYL